MLLRLWRPCSQFGEELETWILPKCGTQGQPLVSPQSCNKQLSYHRSEALVSHFVALFGPFRLVWRVSVVDLLRVDDGVAQSLRIRRRVNLCKRSDNAVGGICGEAMKERSQKLHDAMKKMVVLKPSHRTVLKETGCKISMRHLPKSSGFNGVLSLCLSNQSIFPRLKAH